MGAVVAIYASLTIDFKGVDEEFVKEALRHAIERIGGNVVDATLGGMVIEGDAVTLRMAEQAITDAQDAMGCELGSSGACSQVRCAKPVQSSTKIRVHWGRTITIGSILPGGVCYLYAVHQRTEDGAIHA